MPTLKELMYKRIEIVGIESGTHGRSCGLHEVCGAELKVGTKLRIYGDEIIVEMHETEPITPEPRPPSARGRKPAAKYRSVLVERAIPTWKAFVWANSVATCCVGFVAKSFQARYGSALDGRVVDVSKLYSETELEADHRRSIEHNGMLQAIIIG